MLHAQPVRRSLGKVGFVDSANLEAAIRANLNQLDHKQ